MSNQFALQVTPELMLKLTRDEKKTQRRRQAREKKQGNSISSLPATERRIETDEVQATQAGGWPARDSFLPPFLGPQAPFGGLLVGQPPVQPTQPDENLKKNLAPVYQAIEQSEKIAEKLRQQGDQELEKVKEMARELQDKQYRAPSHDPPCTSERAACVDCYKQNYKNPLLCSKLVQAFVGCSRHAQEAFVASVTS